MKGQCRANLTKSNASPSARWHIGSRITLDELEGNQELTMGTTQQDVQKRYQQELSRYQKQIEKTKKVLEQKKAA